MEEASQAETARAARGGDTEKGLAGAWVPVGSIEGVKSRLGGTHTIGFPRQLRVFSVLHVVSDTKNQVLRRFKSKADRPSPLQSGDVSAHFGPFSQGTANALWSFRDREWKGRQSVSPVSPTTPKQGPGPTKIVRQVCGGEAGLGSTTGRGPFQHWLLVYSPVMARQVHGDRTGLRSSREVSPHVRVRPAGSTARLRDGELQTTTSPPT